MEKLHSKRSKFKSAEELIKLSKEDLIEKIQKLEAHNLQLKNVISKNQNDGPVLSEERKNRKFDFSTCHTRRVLLRIMYLGWDYHGLAVQEDSPQTIEHYLFQSLTKCCLIESRETSQYHRCGRTDKGVSSFGQVMSLTLRSKFPPETQNLKENLAKELPYCKMLNRLLPKEIRIVAWLPSPEMKTDFSARFDCKRRKYKYYFPKSNLNIEAMKKACTYLVGSHDFRNLCKMDVGNGVVQFTRKILNADIICFGNGTDATSMYYLLIEGNAFLWHQIRCIFGILVLIGQNQEEPEVILELLNVEKNPRKPQYPMALDIPLNLFECSYDIDETSNWVIDHDEMKCIIANIQHIWTIHSIKTTMIQDCMTSLENEYMSRVSEKDDKEQERERDSIMLHSNCLIQGVKSKVYVPLLERDTCSSLEERVKHYNKKRKPNETDTDV